MHTLRFHFALIMLTIVGGSTSAEDGVMDAGFFEKKIRPVLVEHCYQYHSAGKKVQGGLLLDSRAGWAKGGDSGSAIVPGKPEESLLLEVLRYESYEMPPEGKLPDSVIADFETWIRGGAPDPRRKTPEAAQTVRVISADELWSLQPIVDSTPPAVVEQGWPRDDLDRFVLHRMEQAGLLPNGDAAPEALIRRIYFDLIGLPPSPAAIEAFVADPSSERYAAVVDRLLGSRHFGERWGRHWLDVARYGESNGNSRNVTFPYAWKYRNYVINALNEDKPFDQFVTEQIAGDLLPAASDERRIEQLTATGFLALGSKPMWFSGKACFTPKESVEPDWVDEQVDAVGKAFLGIAIGCSRCHNHKFDPVPMHDYYALAGIFASTKLYCGPKDAGTIKEWKETQVLDPWAIPLGSSEEIARAESLQRELAMLRAEHEEVEQSLKRKEQLSEADVDRLERLREELGQRIALIEKQSPRFDYVMGVLDAEVISDARLRIRGQWDKPSERVPRGFLSQVPSSRDGSYSIPANQSGRLELARWIVDPANPLTARVFVNRVWHHLFGRGIVASTDTFGSMGTPPTHPQLLDHLAAGFINDGWSTKRLIRRIVLSRTYRLSSGHHAKNFAADPDNQWFWRMNRRRLEAEALRDSILLASGRLETSPLEGSAIAAMGYKLLSPADVNKARSSPQSRHRSVYIAAVRGLPADDFLKVFDLPEPSNILGNREATTIAPQALVLMNSPLVIEQMQAMADRLIAEADSPGDRIRKVNLWLIGREPDRVELREALAFLADPESDERDSLVAYCQSLLFTAEFRTLY